MSPIVNRRDLDFLLYEVLDVEGLLAMPRYRSFDRATISELLDTAQRIAEEKYQSIAGRIDEHEPAFEEGRVTILPEVGEALRTYAAAGLFGASFDESLGGLQLPWTVTMAINGLFSCANVGVANYSFLTVANANLLALFGSEEQKRLYLPPMLKGHWFGTMCLSEPQAGSSLSDIRARAEPLGDGTYRITGSKMWISGGDHELSENIVHLVLAKIPGGPFGAKGISLFVVPRYRVTHDGSLGAWNNIALAGLNHKMGHRGTTNCLLNFGEQGDCIGTLIGEPHKGLGCMFHMMNEARVGVGHAAVMSGLAGYLYSLDYARSRAQGRHPQNKDPSSPQLPIVEHADVKRMLMAQKASVEGALSLILYCAGLIDQRNCTSDAAERVRLGLLLDILTPIAKSWPAEHCLEANKLAIQVLGGYGYTRDYPVERFYRDNRLNHIHEGTYAIHGIDLLGRKVRLQDGAALRLLLDEIRATIKEAKAGFVDHAAALEQAIRVIEQTTAAVVASEDLDLGLANATLYLDALGHVVIAWMWLRQAIAAQAGSASVLEAEAVADAAFYAGKLAGCRYFFRYELPHAIMQAALVATLDDTCLALQPEHFVGV